MAKPDSASFWRYDPSTALAIAGAILYLITTIVTLFQYFKYRAWVWLFFVVAVIFELVGFGARVVSAKNINQQGPFIIQLLLIIIAPVLMAAGCYIVFGRIVFRVLSKQHLTTRTIWVPPRFLTPIFFTSDIFAFFLQAIGAATIASVKDTDKNFKTKENRGKAIVLAGLVLQIVVFGLFSVIAARFHFVGRRLALPNDQLLMAVGNRDKKRQLRPNWELLLGAVNAACVCILARSVYRVIEFAEGTNGYAQTKEWTFYVFDFLPIFFCVVVFIIIHPAKYVPHLGFRQPKAIDMGTILPSV